MTLLYYLLFSRFVVNGGRPTGRPRRPSRTTNAFCSRGHCVVSLPISSWNQPRKLRSRNGSPIREQDTRLSSGSFRETRQKIRGGKTWCARRSCWAACVWCNAKMVGRRVDAGVRPRPFTPRTEAQIPLGTPKNIKGLEEIQSPYYVGPQGWAREAMNSRGWTRVFRTIYTRSIQTAILKAKTNNQPLLNAAVNLS